MADAVPGHIRPDQVQFDHLFRNVGMRIQDSDDHFSDGVVIPPSACVWSTAVQ